jgi:hypothetical protein
MSAPLHPLAGIREEHRTDWQAALRARLANQRTHVYAMDTAIRIALTLESPEAAKAYAEEIAHYFGVGDLSRAEDWDEWEYHLILDLKQPRPRLGPTGGLIIITPYLQVVLHRLEDLGVKIGNQPDEWHRRA